MKLKNSNCDENQNLKLWRKSKTQIVMKLKNSNLDETQKLKLWLNSKTEILTILKLWQTQIVKKLNTSNCDKTQIVTNYEKKINCDKTQQLQLWINLKSQMVTKLEVWQISINGKIFFFGSFSKNILIPWQRMMRSLGTVLQFLLCLSKVLKKLLLIWNRRVKKWPNCVNQEHWNQCVLAYLPCCPLASKSSTWHLAAGCLCRAVEQ